MQNKALVTKKRLILGLGKTGLSIARYLDKCGQEYNVMDSRTNPPGQEELASFANDSLIEWHAKTMQDYDELVVSPGIAISRSEIQAAAEKGASIIGDIELFAQVNNKPVIAITGSNGKSTVTELVAELIDASGLKSAIGGNFGIPALDLLDSDADIIVLELSSFQLETTASLKPVCATILNISEDHLDRYLDYQAYIDAKQRVYRSAQTIIFNQDDKNTHAQKGDTKGDVKENAKTVSFGLTAADWKLDKNKENIIGKNNLQLPLNELKLQGIHNALNVAAAIALLNSAGIEISKAVIKAAKEYKGLPHRCEWVGNFSGVTYINDSKATNVGATLAAIESFSPQYKNIILIVGGDAKGADLAPLKGAITHFVKAMICFGQDAKQLFELAADKSYLVNSLEQAVEKAAELAYAKDLVLLSPACASIDMFDNYMQRGNQFMELVRAQA